MAMTLHTSNDNNQIYQVHGSVTMVNVNDEVLNVSVTENLESFA